MKCHSIPIVAVEGEGQRIEFKEGFSRLDRELVAFANASGGSVFIGISDNGVVRGADMSNHRQGEIVDIGRNCDPPISLDFIRHPEKVLEVIVNEGPDKPYRCKDGFFLRVGPSCRKLDRNEIASLIVRQGNFHYDELTNSNCLYPDDFDALKLEKFLALCGVSVHADPANVLCSLDCAKQTGKGLRLSNAAVLFFARQPQRFLKESYVTGVRYAGVDRLTVIDRKDLYGDIITIIEESIAFVARHTNAEQRILAGQTRHEHRYEYPPVAVREALINAAMHRDYYNDSSHIFIHIFSDRMEIENPGGLPGGLALEELGERSVRRNRSIADLLYRAGYVEKIGSGIQRMRKALEENNNPPLTISVTNYFVLRFFPKVRTSNEISLTARQAALVGAMQNGNPLSASEVAVIINASPDSALRELRVLLDHGIVTREGTGRSTRYRITG